MDEWTTGKSKVPLFHIDGKHNIEDLLTKKHELSVESVTELCVADWCALYETGYRKHAIISL